MQAHCSLEVCVGGVDELGVGVEQVSAVGVVAGSLVDGPQGEVVAVAGAEGDTVVCRLAIGVRCFVQVDGQSVCEVAGVRVRWGGGAGRGLG